MIIASIIIREQFENKIPPGLGRFYFLAQQRRFWYRSKLSEQDGVKLSLSARRC